MRTPGLSRISIELIISQHPHRRSRCAVLPSWPATGRISKAPSGRNYVRSTAARLKHHPDAATQADRIIAPAPDDLGDPDHGVGSLVSLSEQLPGALLRRRRRYVPVRE